MLSLFSVSSVAASLDVHGEIKINGKTVIDNKGQFVNQSSLGTIDFSDYEIASPNKKITLEAIGSRYSDMDESETVRKTVFTYDEQGHFLKEESFDDDKLMFSLIVTQRTDDEVLSSNTYINEHDGGGK